MFALEIYGLTKKFPSEERYGLIDQLRRASVSITSNIAEGFYRRTAKDKSHFYTTSAGSLAEIQNQLLMARDLGYLDKTAFNTAAQESVEIHKMLNSLIAAVRSKT